MGIVALLADFMTVSRLGLALIVGGAVATDRLGLAAVVLVVAWATDVFDGMLARAATSPTRLGDWDFRVDVTLGIALLAGLAAADHLHPLLAVGILLIGVGWTQVSGNPAPAMLMMAVGYGRFLILLVSRQPDLWWVPFAAMPILLVLQWRRFSRVVLPAFFHGARRIGSGNGKERPPILDEWA